MRLAGLFAALALFVAGCGGGSTATPDAESSAASMTTVVTSQAQSGAQISLGSVGSVTSGMVALPAVTAGSGAALTVTITVEAARRSQGLRRGPEAISNPAAFADITIATDAPVTFTGAFTVSFTDPGGPAPYYGTFEDPAGNLTGSGPLAPASSVYSLSSPNATFMLAAGQSISFDFATALPPALATPSPSPSSSLSPSPSPSGSATASPTASPSPSPSPTASPTHTPSPPPTTSASPSPSPTATATTAATANPT